MRERSTGWSTLSAGLTAIDLIIPTPSGADPWLCLEGFLRLTDSMQDHPPLQASERQYSPPKKQNFRFPGERIKSSVFMPYKAF